MTDFHQRQQALNLAHSVIVQAPAGSGKTELLCRRFLTALAHVSHPSQIVAITFTRKAAQEMRERLMRYLKNPAQAPPEAQQALIQNEKHQWQLLQYPEQLMILTIDSLCASIVDQLPLESGIYGFQIAETPTLLYQKAIRSLFNDIDRPYPWNDALKTLLSYFNNQWSTVAHLLSQMLEKREQWLSLLAEFSEPESWRKQLEKNLRACVEDALQHAKCFFTKPLQDEIQSLIAFANTHGAICPSWQNLTAWPKAKVSQIIFWKELANFLLTQEGNFRKSIDKRCGFPVGEGELKALYKAYKTRMLTLLEELTLMPGCAQCLDQLRNAPTACYSEIEWQNVLAILTVLKTALAYLHLTMNEERTTDFIEIALRALTLLKQNSPLAYQLDSQYQHILVDEFQDTSLLQYELLSQLTSQWQKGDGHSIFLVGDPLQSIYRFRQAEVGLFLRLWEKGFPHLPLTPLLLTQNFRTQKKLVDFFNDHLAKILPTTANAQENAIPYSPLQATKEVSIENAFDIMLACEEYEEKVTINIRTQQDTHPTYLTKLLNDILYFQSQHKTGAILVRSRTHLKNILSALRKAKISFTANDLTSLADQPVICDLISWLHALLHLEDRLAWLAVLHAPWLHISLNTLQTLFNDDKTLVWERLLQWQENPIEQAQLSDQQSKALHQVVTHWHHALIARQVQPIDQIFFTLWENLGGENYWTDPFAKKAIQQFWRLLSEHLLSTAPNEWENFFTRLTQTSFSSEIAESSLQVMTIHKAKGLEFDYILLPALEQTSQHDELPLLLFDEVMLSGGPTWILAPIRKSLEEPNKIFNFLWQLQKKKNNNERLRLLYVALTRAKHAICAYAEIKSHQDFSPKPGSLLADLHSFR